MQTELHDHLQQALGDAYAIERELGGGGMSRVFLAVEQSLGRRVVVKVLPPELASVVSEARFQREILVAANLQHPHILPVLAAGARDGLLYYSMPYVEGQSLRERIALDGPLPVPEAAGILHDLASALAYAHARGVIHRDVKPDNILLSGGHAVLADFGIARALAQATHADRLTGAGSELGTPGYMAPEQLAGDPTVDARADVYALGVVGYEMLAGRTPFTGPTPHAIASAYFTKTPRPLEEIRPEVPVTLARTIRRALDRDPERRFATAAELRDALPPVIGDAQRAERRRRRRRREIGFTLLALAGVAGAGVLGARLRPRADAAAFVEKTLLVLPFRNLGRPEDAYFADGVSEELTSRLASLADLGVISRNSAEQYRDSEKPLDEIARDVGAEYVLTGSVRWDRRAGGQDRVRVTPQLIRVRDGKFLWADRYDAELNDIFDVQSRIAERVAGALAVALANGDRGRIDARPTASVAAWDLYTRGEQLRASEATNPDALVRAAELLGQATAADPRFALAYAKLSLANQMLYDRFIDRTPARLAAAGRAAEAAHGLDASLPEAHLALGVHYESRGDFERAGAEYTLAERGRPNDGLILAQAAGVLTHRGRWDEALKRFRRAADLDPRSVIANLSAATAFAFTRDSTSAFAYADRALAADSAGIRSVVRTASLELVLSGDRARARRGARAAMLRFGAERCATTDGFDTLLGTLEPADRATLAQVSPAAFGNNRVIYLYWRVALFEGWRPELARAHADSLIQAGDTLLRDDPDSYQVHAALGWLHALRGERAAAEREARRSLVLMPRSRDALAWTDVALMAAGTFVRVGNHAAALDQLEQLLGVPALVSVPALRTDPLWASLADEPRFRRLLARDA
jgi:serine/threonine-protein kinase